MSITFVYAFYVLNRDQDSFHDFPSFFLRLGLRGLDDENSPSLSHRAPTRAHSLSPARGRDHYRRGRGRPVAYMDFL